MSMSPAQVNRNFFKLALLPAVLMSLHSIPGHASPLGDKWSGYWDNTLTYNLGFRAKSMDSKIGNNPSFDESNYKFSDRGDIVTNRINILTEGGLNYDDRLAFRASAQAWHDFAYDKDVDGHPSGAFDATAAYSSGKYRSGVKNSYISGGRLLDAFMLYGDEMAGVPYTIRLGRTTQYWGNSMFFAMQGISYSQGAMDGIAGSASPGTPAKALFLPRAQINVGASLTPSFSFGFQYFLENAENELPQGGTFLAPADFLFTGQDSMLGIKRGKTRHADDINDNFGLMATWQVTPSSTLSLFYRRLDEVQPWAPLLALDNGTPNYFLSYNEGVKLYGISLDAPLGNSSLGMEVSYRKGTALNSTPNPGVAGDPFRGATGNVVNVIANVMMPLTTTPLYDAGTLIAEVAHTRVISVDGENRSLHNREGTVGCAGDKWTGCSTRNATALAVQFNPEWLQVFPAVDFSMPTTVTVGLKGNPGILGGTAQGYYKFSVGVQAKYRTRHTLKVEYIGSRARTTGGLTDYGVGPAYAAGNGAYSLNDRDWVSITAQTVF